MAQQDGSRTNTTFLLGEGPAMMCRSGTVVSLGLGVRLEGVTPQLYKPINCIAL